MKFNIQLVLMHYKYNAMMLSSPHQDSDFVPPDIDDSLQYSTICNTLVQKSKPKKSFRKKNIVLSLQEKSKLAAE